MKKTRTKSRMKTGSKVALKEPPTNLGTKKASTPEKASKRKGIPRVILDYDPWFKISAMSIEIQSLAEDLSHKAEDIIERAEELLSGELDMSDPCNFEALSTLVKDIHREFKAYVLPTREMYKIKWPNKVDKKPHIQSTKIRMSDYIPKTDSREDRAWWCASDQWRQILKQLCEVVSSLSDARVFNKMMERSSFIREYVQQNVKGCIALLRIDGLSIEESGSLINEYLIDSSLTGYLE